jgi:hypothetical protein
MAGDATTLPLLQTPKRRGLRWRTPSRGDTVDEAASSTRLRGTIALVSIVVLSVFVVVMSADRPSLLSPTSHDNFYPHWLAGPLGGLWPGMSGNSTTLRYLFSGAIVLMYVGYLVVLKSTAKLSVRWVLGAIVAVHAVFLLSPPLALTDLFNYLNYGRMEAVHNLNPYTSIPILEPHNDPAYALSNWHQLLSPYGPLFTILTFAVVPLGVAASFWALKTILGLASLATIFLVWKCARLLGRDPVTAVAMVGLNPIVLVWGLGGDHNDFLMVFCIMLGFYLLLRARSSIEPSQQARGGLRAWLAPLSPAHVGAGVAFVVSTGIKASGGVLIPVALAGLLRNRRALTQVLLGMAGATILVAAVSLLTFGLHTPDLSTQSRLVTSESVPNLIGLAVGAGGESEALHKLMSAALVISIGLCCWMAWRRSPEGGSDLADGSGERTIEASGWASVALLVTLSWVLPWYVLWVLPLAALSGSRRLRRASVLVGVYLILAWAPASGQLWNAIGFHPEKTSLGRLHQRYVRELLN